MKLWDAQAGPQLKDPFALVLPHRLRSAQAAPVPERVARCVLCRRR